MCERTTRMLLRDWCMVLIIMVTTTHHGRTGAPTDSSEHPTLVCPCETPEPKKGATTSLSPELLDQIRGRIRLLALFVMIGTAVDPLFYFAEWLAESLQGRPIPADFAQRLGFQWIALGTIAISGGLRWASRKPGLSTDRLVSLGLAYEILICFGIALSTYWEDFVARGYLPSLTWVAGVVILFPLILPGPPRRMAAGAVAAAAMSPIALLLLDLWGKVQTTPNNYLQAIISPGIAVLCAFYGSRVVYGLGKELAAARELGSYRLEEKLGEGGMGEVWRARHRLLARPAAIKLIRHTENSDGRNWISPEALQRFEREAQATASLRSPHTVNVFDFGIARDGAFYYVMELLDGLDAYTLVKRFGPLPAERVVFLLRQVCHSLSEAESVGLVHRDIKPANLFVCRYGEDHDFVKVLDFGLVKALPGNSDGIQHLTRENMVQGTPAFISPEQVMGKSDLDGRVDIYAVGCVAYWLLTGQLVFDAPSPATLLVHHASTLPSAPSARTELPIPKELDQLVLACLEKDPARRPQSARELSVRLAGTVDPAAWNEERAREWWAKHYPSRG